MEEGEATSATDADAEASVEEIRQRRLAYFQTASSEKTQALGISNKLQTDKQGVRKRSSESVPLKNDKTVVSTRTSEFHVKVSSNKATSSVRDSSQSENDVSFSGSRLSQDRPRGSLGITREPAVEKRKGGLSGASDRVSNLSAKLPHPTSDVNMTPKVSDTTPRFSNLPINDSDRLRWASSAGVRPPGSERAYSGPARKSGDREVESLFSTRKSTSASEIPALSLKESVDIDSVSVFKSRADIDELGLSTHRPESSSSSSVRDFGDRPHFMRQRSMSSESLLLGSKAEEIRSLLGEEKYREFVEKSDLELHQLHRMVDSPASSINWSGGGKPSDRVSRVDGPGHRNIPTPPPHPPSPQPSGPGKVGPSPRRRLRSSSPQLVSKTLQDIARTKEVREAGTSRNYEQVVVPRNITFSADEIYRQAYGREGGDLGKSSNTSLGSSYQDTSFWSGLTPLQRAGGMSPTSPHTAPLFQPHFMPVGGGGPVRPPPPPPPSHSQPMTVGSPGGTYFYPQGAGVSMAGTGAKQFVYTRPPGMFMPMSPGSSPQSPEAYFYHVHPLSQSVAGFHPAPSSPMQTPPVGLSWQFGPPSMGQEFQTQQDPGLQWNQFDPRFQQNHYHGGQSWQQQHQQQQQGSGGHPGVMQTPQPPPHSLPHPASHSLPHPPPTKVVGKGVVVVGGEDGEKSGKWKNRSSSSAEHADAVRQFHEQQRHEQVKLTSSLNSSQASGEFPPSTSSIERYFASLGMPPPPPPNYPPPPYHHHHHHPLSPSSHHTHQPLSSSRLPTMMSTNHAQQGNGPAMAGEGQNLRQSSLSDAVNGSEDYEDMTTVTRTSWATGTSLRAGGITNRLETLGVDPVVLNNIRQRSADVAAADEEALEAMRTLVRICPECLAVNKEYMTWCLQCGGVLIGVDPLPAKDLKKKNREKKGAGGGGADSAAATSRMRKTSSQGSLDGSVSSTTTTASEIKVSGSLEVSGVERTVPVEVRHQDSFQDPSNHSARSSLEAQNYRHPEPVLEFEEIIEEEILYSSKTEPDQCSSELDEIPERISRVMELQDNVLPEEAVESKESPESGRGASASSSPCQHNVLAEDRGEASQHAVEVSDNKDSGRPSSGEGAESRKPQVSSQLVPNSGPQRSEKEINEICEVINDPIIRGFIKNYLQKKPRDPAAGLAQSIPNKRQDFPQKTASERQSSNDGTKPNKKTVPKAFSLDLDTGVVMNSTASSKPSSTTKKEDTPKRKGGKKSVKKGHEAIDVEVFAIEEAKLLRCSQSGANIVPKLKLVNSSDEDDDSSEKTSSLHGVSQGSISSEASSPCEDSAAPVNYSTELESMAVGSRGEVENNPRHPQSHSPQPSLSQPNPQLSNSHFLYLKEQVETQGKKSSTGVGVGGSGGGGGGSRKTSGQSRHQPRPNPAASKVRSSVEASAPSRHWMRSSIAWSSYHPRELRTRSSLNLQSAVGGGSGGGGGGGGGRSAPRQSAGNFRVSRSSDNLVNSPAPPGEMPPSQRPRPASADQNNRLGGRGKRGRPSSAGGCHQRPHSVGFYSPPVSVAQQHCYEGATAGAAGDQSSSGSNSQAESPRFEDNKDIEGRPIHRLAVQENTLPLIPAGPSTALKIYDRCFEMIPRDEGEQESKWLFLPDELWLHVFSYLPQQALFQAMLTCKQLYRMAMDPQLWKSVTVRKKSVKNEWLSEIGRRCPVSLALVQCHGNQLSENALRELFKEVAPKLKELNFSRCSKGKLIGDEILLHASTYCRHLTHVDASWCHVTDVGLTALAGCCHRLESLCLNGCQQITDESLKSVVEKHGTSLRVLELFGCFSLSPASFTILASHCSLLITLNLGQCYKLTDSAMEILSGSLSRVETLDLRGCKKLGDGSIKKIVRNCVRLRHLVLANCPQLSNASIVEIATYSKDIRSLDVCGCSKISDSSIQSLVKNCCRLTSIDISSTTCTHRSVLMLADCSHYLESAKFNFLADIHEQSLARLIKNCKRLNTVHLYGCNVRDVSALKRHNRFLNIEL